MDFTEQTATTVDQEVVNSEDDLNSTPYFECYGMSHMEEIDYVDATYHSCSCSSPITKISGEHTGGTATCTSGAICSLCNTEYGDLDANAHELDYKYSDSEHWQQCTNVNCPDLEGSKTATAVHSFVNGACICDYICDHSGRNQTTGECVCDVKATPVPNPEKLTTARVRRNNKLSAATITNGEFFAVDGTTFLKAHSLR